MQFHDDPNWMPSFTVPFADEVALFVSHKRALGFAFGETSCYRLRSMDRLFGDIKRNMGFTRFTLRGLDKAGLEFRLVAMGHNIRKMMRAIAKAGA